MLMPNKTINCYEQSPYGKLTMRKFFREFIGRLQNDEISGLAAQLAFYFIFSMFPLMIFLLTLTPYLNIDQQYVLHLIQSNIPGNIGDVIFQTISEVLNNRSTTLLAFSLLAALWSASTGVFALMGAFNIAFRHEEHRNWLIVRTLSVFFTLVLSLMFIMMLILLVFGKQLGKLILNYLPKDTDFSFIWEVIRLGLPPIVIIVILTFLYRLAPSVKTKFISSVPGAIFAMLGGLVVTSLFSYYVGNFGNYSKMYGSIGGVIAMLFWLYLMGFILILGAEINAIFHNYYPKKRWLADQESEGHHV